jgi:hypothetical protein
MYILIFSALARELNEPVRARKRAEPSWLVSLTSKLKFGRAELARYPPLPVFHSCPVSDRVRFVRVS